MNTSERRGTPPMKMFVHGRPERRFAMSRVNPLMGKGNYTATLNNNNEVGTLAVDGWAVIIDLLK